jgi:hypothetical protein
MQGSHVAGGIARHRYEIREEAGAYSTDAVLHVQPIGLEASLADRVGRRKVPFSAIDRNTSAVPSSPCSIVSTPASTALRMPSEPIATGLPFADGSLERREVHGLHEMRGEACTLRQLSIDSLSVAAHCDELRGAISHRGA